MSTNLLPRTDNSNTVPPAFARRPKPVQIPVADASLDELDAELRDAELMAELEPLGEPDGLGVVEERPRTKAEPRLMVHDEMYGTYPAEFEGDPERIESWLASQAMINDAMNNPEARSGSAAWHGRVERETPAREQREAEFAASEHARAAADDQAIEMFTAIREYIKGYLVLPPKFADAYLDVMTLWVIHTYCYKVAGVTPYLSIVAPTKGSGKTTVLEVLSTLANNPSKIEVGPTAPVVRHYASQAHSLFLDEIDTLAKDTNFVAVMNSGYKSGGSVTRMAKKQGDDVTITSATFCPKAIAGIAEEGRLPLPDATLDRCIEIKIFRALPGELTKRFRVDVMRDEPEVAAMRAWMSVWTQVHYRDLRDAYFEVPQLSSSRAEQIYEPLVTIGCLLSEEIGNRIRAAAVLLDMDRPKTLDTNSALITDLAQIVTAYQEAAPTATQIRLDTIIEFHGLLTGKKLDKKMTVELITKRLGAFSLFTEVVVQNGKDTLVYTIGDGDGNLTPDWSDLFKRYASLN